MHEEDAMIRPILPDDLPALKAVIDATDLFPSDLLDEMVASYFSDDAGEDMWLTIDDGGPVAVAYYAVLATCVIQAGNVAG
jgi:hypothetical protein